MPSDANSQFFDFEKPIKELIDEIAGMKHRQEKNKIFINTSCHPAVIAILIMALFRFSFVFFPS
jgi:hypothetical protein